MGALLLAAALLAALVLPAHAAESERGWHGNYFPNSVLTTQDGKKVRFYDDVLKGKIVSINFVYTNCGDVCPLDTAQLVQVQRLLGARVGKDVFMYSISVDPENDTPEAMKRYMHMFGVGPGWTFLTGARADIELIQKKLGMRPAQAGKLREHDVRLIAGNEPAGQWIKRSPYDDPVILANLFTDTLGTAQGGPVGRGLPYEHARQVKTPSRGQYLFRTRCDSCHTIGGGDRLGPDLRGVVGQRDPAWLRRWLKEPDKMLKEGDPLATAMKQKYRNLPMPNLGLNDVDAEALIEFLNSEDARLGADSKAAKP